MEHRVRKGVVEFLTLWKGYPQEEATWEPVGKFFHRYASELVKYANENGLGECPVLKYLSSEPDGGVPPRKN